VADVFYTLDGVEPTTNSLRLALTNNIGMIQWHETLRDLTSLRLKAIAGTNASVTVSGTPSSTSEIGITRNLVAGIGSTVIIPLVVNLRTNDALRSIQFRVEITPTAGTSSIISDQFRSLSISSNDFIHVATSSSDSLDPATFGSSAYLLGNTRGLTISFIGTNANFSIKNFAVVAMLAVPIPATANLGDSYRISVLEASGTSDGLQDEVELFPMPNRIITVTNVAYTTGDSAPSGWYNAGDFGNGDLKNNDVNNAFLAL
jgi:hypothetical protein